MRFQLHTDQREIWNDGFQISPFGKFRPSSTEDMFRAQTWFHHGFWFSLYSIRLLQPSLAECSWIPRHLAHGMAQALQDNDQSSLLVVHEALFKQGAPEEANFQP